MNNIYFANFKISLISACASILLISLAEAAEKAIPEQCPSYDNQQNRKLVNETCKDIQSWLKNIPGGAVSVRKGPFEDERFSCMRVGCEVVLSGKFSSLGKSEQPEILIEERLRAEGWVHTSAHDADGPDGTTFSMHKPGVLCIVEGSWNHWDDEDGSHADDAFETKVSCGLSTRQAPRYEDLL